MANMTALIQQLSGNPLQTPIGLKIEQATDPTLPAEDWNLNMLICDMINDTDEGPKDAVRAIRRRLQNAGKNHTMIMYTLTVLETCTKNCGRRFHLLVTNKDFVQELVKLIGPKNDPPLILQQKVLSIIQTWADAFRGQPDLNGVVQVYNDLKVKSIEFPPSNYECQVPIHTPQRSVRVQPPANHIPLYQHALGINTSQLPTIPVQVTQLNNFPVATRMTGQIVLNDEQMTKLKSELEIVNANMKVYNEMLTELDNSKSLKNEDLELLHELNMTCQQMQRRIVELLDRVSNEEITSELLTVNDNLNSLFARYQVYSAKGPAQANAVQLMTDNQTSNQQPVRSQIANPTEGSLIDLGEANLSDQMDGLQLGAVGGDSPQSQIQQLKPQSNNSKLIPTPRPPTASAQTGDKDFDEFAHSRNERQIQPPRTIDGIELPNDQEATEMEQWLKEQNSEAPASLSNTEFDRFLESRFNNLETEQSRQQTRNKPSGDLLDL